MAEFREVSPDRLPEGTFKEVSPDRLSKGSDDAHDSSEYEDKPGDSRLTRMRKGVMKPVAELRAKARDAAEERKDIAAAPFAVRAFMNNVGPAEVMAKGASSLASSVAGGIAGLGQLAATPARYLLSSDSFGESLDKSVAGATDTIRAVQKAGTYEPRLASSKLVDSMISTPMEMLASVSKNTYGAAGDVVGPKTGLAAESWGEIAPAVAGTLLGGRAAMGAVGTPSGLPKTIGGGATATTNNALRQTPRPVPGASAEGPLPTPVPALPGTTGAAAQAAPAPAAGGSVGAGGMTQPAVRVANQQVLGGAPPLMKFQAEKDAPQTTVAREAMKRPGGEPMLERWQAQQEFIPERLDRLIDATESKLALDDYTFGGAIHDSVGGLVKNLKNGIKSAYQKADASPEANMKVVPSNVQAIISELESKGTLESYKRQAPVLDTIMSGLRKMEKGGEKPVVLLDAQGKPFRAPEPTSITVRQLEELRKEINGLTDPAGDKVNYGMGVKLKRAIDADLETAGGELYKQARTLRREYGARFEDYKNLSDLITIKGAEHKIPFDKVFERLVVGGNRESIVHLRRVLREAADGDALWKEVQAQTLNDILQSTVANRTPLPNGKYAPSIPKLNAAIKKYERGGKLDTILGKEMANEVRALRQYGEDALVDVANNFINRSNTAVISELDRRGLFGKAAKVVEKLSRPVKGVHALAEYADTAAAKANIERISREQLAP